MKNLDTMNQEAQELYAALHSAMKNDDVEAFTTAFSAYANSIQNKVIAEAQELRNVNDVAILAQRGVRQLTSEENTYYNSVIDAMRSSNPKQALTDIEKVLPKTTIDSVFDNLTEAHPLLDLIDFQNTEALVEILVSTSAGVAIWGELCDEITAELSAAFAMVPLTLKKLSAYIPVCNAMLDLGPVWLDRYVRELLAEAIAAGAEAGIVDGDGKDKPLGMTRQTSGATDGVYPRKTAITVTELTPQSIGAMLSTISLGPNNKRRAVPRLLMVVNPADYYSKVYPATTVRAADGTFNTNVHPYPMDVVMSAAMPEGFAVFGLASQYFFGLGTAKGGKLEYSDDVKFLEDQRVYRIKLYGNGLPKDENAFVYANITGLQPAVLDVRVTNPEEFPSA